MKCFSSIAGIVFLYHLSSCSRSTQENKSLDPDTGRHHSGPVGTGTSASSDFIPSTANSSREGQGLLSFDVKLPNVQSYGLSAPAVNPETWSWEISIVYSNPAGKNYRQSGSLALNNGVGTISLPATGFGTGKLTLTLSEAGVPQYSGSTEAEINNTTKAIKINLAPLTTKLDLEISIPNSPIPSSSTGPSPEHPTPTNPEPLFSPSQTQSASNWNQRKNEALDEWSIEFLPTN